MDDRSGSPLVNQFAGDGWLLRGGVRLGQVTYAIDIFEVRTSLAGSVVTAAYSCWVRPLSSVVVNGRCFDRGALNQLLVDAETAAQR
jgi:hypothetical protein